MIPGDPEAEDSTVEPKHGHYPTAEEPDVHLLPTAGPDPNAGAARGAAAGKGKSDAVAP